MLYMYICSCCKFVIIAIYAYHGLYQVHIYNQRYRVQRLVEAACQLAMHGRAKSVDKQGIDEISEKAGEVISKGEYYNPDPLGMRDGNACDPKLGQV